MKRDRLIVRKRSKLPKCIRHFKELKGICIGGCINAKDTISKKHSAHAHPCKGDKYQGWICLRHKYQLREKLTLLHEVAHLIANKSWSTAPHGERWRKAVVAIGGTFKPYLSYSKKTIYNDFSPKKKRK